VTQIVNLLDCGLRPYEDGPPGHRFSARPLTYGRDDAKLTGIGLYEIEPGQATWPYHFEVGEEEWLIVVSGEVTLRTPGGERVLRAGDTVCFPAGAAGAHAIRNDGSEVARFAMPSRNAEHFGATVYPDSNKISVGGEGFHYRGRIGEELDYWEGEQ
jgi:uncharacterized cupin superfamily protein